jgi:2-polyprenyl-6-methoxyphenol hydroxylase-like FAD-dependent oxidoreductase
MIETRPVLVVGAGPTGMTAALELSRMKVPVRLIDKVTHPATTSRALAVHARTLELMAQRGIAERMLAAGIKGNATTIYSDGKVLGRVDLNRIQSPFNYALLIPQSETERILREQLEAQSVPIEFGTELVAISQESEHDEHGSVRAILKRSDGGLEDLEAAYVIASEGAHSLVRNTLGLAFQGKSLPHVYALADLHLEAALPEDELSIFVPVQGLLAVFPIGNKRFRVIAIENKDEEVSQGTPSLEYMQALWNRSSHIPARLYDMLWSSQFRINSRMVDHLSRGRIFFGGDSAHIHSPAGGQGMNTGIQDMVNLGWKLALVYKGLAPSKLLGTYETERLPVIRTLVGRTESATDAMTSDSPFLHRLISLAAPAALHFEHTQQQAAKILSQTGTSYEDSPLTEKGGNVADVHAGERILLPWKRDGRVWFRFEPIWNLHRRDGMPKQC